MTPYELELQALEFLISRQYVPAELAEIYRKKLYEKYHTTTPE